MLNQLSFKGQWRQYQQRVLDKSESFHGIDGNEFTWSLLLALEKRP